MTTKKEEASIEQETRDLEKAVELLVNLCKKQRKDNIALEKKYLQLKEQKDTATAEIELALKQLDEMEKQVRA